MANPNTPPGTSGQVLPPFLNLPWGQVREGGQVFLGPQALEFLQFLFSSIGGSGSLTDQATIAQPNAGDMQVTAAAVARDIAQAIAFVLDAGPSPSAAPLQGPNPEIPLPRLREVGSMAVPWTPLVAGTTTPGAQTYGTQWGWSVALGPVTLALYSVALTALDGATAGNVVVKGLPAAAALTGPDKQAGWISRFSNITLAANNHLGADVAPGASQIALVESVSAGANTALPAAALSATSAVVGGVAFFR